MSHYRRHLFFCTNRRDDGSENCAGCGAVDARAYVKERLKALGLHGPGQMRANKSGCLGRCSEGPVVVVYPEEVWYTYVDREDLDEIIESHLIHGEPVERLKI